MHQTQNTMDFAYRPLAEDSQAPIRPVLLDSDGDGPPSPIHRRTDPPEPPAKRFRSMEVLSVAELREAITGHERQITNEVFQVRAQVLGSMPRGPVIVQPYKGLLTFVNFRIVVTDGSDGEPLDIEFNTEEELCHLFEVLDPSEAWDKATTMEENLAQVLQIASSPLGPQLVFVVRRLSFKLPSGLIYYYWATLTTLSDLVAQTQTAN